MENTICILAWYMLVLAGLGVLSAILYIGIMKLHNSTEHMGVRANTFAYYFRQFMADFAEQE